jgi:UDP-galactopyranose mutase
VSTPITDVIRHYGDLDAVTIADGTEAFIAGCERALALVRGSDEWLDDVDAKLANISWDTTYARMAGLVREATNVTASGPRPVTARVRRSMIISWSEQALQARCSRSGWRASTMRACW